MILVQNKPNVLFWLTGVYNCDNIDKEYRIINRNKEVKSFMTNRERENATLSFQKPDIRGSVQETFLPWPLTIERFRKEGLPDSIADGASDTVRDPNIPVLDTERYLNVAWGEGVMKFETYMGFDAVRRIRFKLPFRVFDEKVLEETDEYTIFIDKVGRQKKKHKNSGLVEDYREVVICAEDWERLKEYSEKLLEKYYTDENIVRAYGPLREGQERGDYSVRMNIEGFFWTPRELLGIEPHLYAFYDCPELIHDINEYILNIYLEKLTKVLEVLPVDVAYFNEDLSGKTGPMISPDIFDEFVGSYYKRLIPVLKSKGIRHMLVDTDGDFKKLIPNFIKAGVEGFVPMDVNAGMDIVAIREEFPRLKFIGAFNKLCIAEGKQSIDKEFERIMPVIRQGGYIPCTDHQVAPSTSLDDYRYYIMKLKEAMEQCGADL
ncbi:MAG: Uroporphyrinogen decarboxylase (URO-D) [Firmicutes bacterium ADurb.Bin193]|nr:MAG: Uroporphyrinogen decarboxylase (URO-D) [Firmicutes bacterium ADurb.Bin193]